MNGFIMRVVFHAAGAAVFFFILQRHVLNESIATSLLWAAALGVAAGALAWSQQRR